MTINTTQLKSHLSRKKTGIEDRDSFWYGIPDYVLYSTPHNSMKHDILLFIVNSFIPNQYAQHQTHQASFIIYPTHDASEGTYIHHPLESTVI